MAKAPPQFNFYYNDWLGGVAHLTQLEKACYLDLLIFQWQHGHIPKNECDRMVLCKCTDIGAWRHIWSKISDKFEPFDLDETTVVFRNARMHEDREHAISVWQQRRSNSKKGVIARRKNTSTKRSTVRLTERLTVSDMDMDKDKDTKTPKKAPRFEPPTEDEVRAYATEADLEIDAAAFVDFYESKGWKVGKGTMKDWRASVRTAVRAGWCKPPLESKDFRF